MIAITFVRTAFSADCALNPSILPKEISEIEKIYRQQQNNKDPYEGCLLFQDDIRPGDDCSLIEELDSRSLIRSWYRFGEPVKDKAYEARIKLVQDLKSKGISVGGGTSLSVVNDRDIARTDFNQKWLATDLSGNPILKGGNEKYATLSAPGFRSYLVQRLVEQAKLGVTELHLGETNGKIGFDDYSLGLQGDDGFVQWIKEKYANKSSEWWKKYLGDLGDAIATKKVVTREMFQKLSPEYRRNFQSEWGKEDSWHGTNEKDQPAFLAHAYRKNLESLLKELKVELKKTGNENVSVDIWGGSGMDKEAISIAKCCYCITAR